MSNDNEQVSGVMNAAPTFGVRDAARWPPKRQLSQATIPLWRVDAAITGTVFAAIATAVAWWRSSGDVTSWWWTVPAVVGLATLWGVTLQPKISHKHYWWDIGDNTLIVREGFITRTTKVLTVDRVQSVTLESSWLQRKFGLADVRCEALGEDNEVVCLSTQTAEQLTAYLSSIIRDATGDGS